LKLPVRAFGARINLSVIRGRSAERMIVNGIAEIANAEFFARFGCGKAAVVNAAVVRRKDRGVVLGPSHDVGEVAAGLDLAEVPVGPVRSSGRKSDGEYSAIVAEMVTDHSDSAVGGKKVGIESDFARAVQAVRGVEHALWLEARVMRVENTLFA